MGWKSLHLKEIGLSDHGWFMGEERQYETEISLKELAILRQGVYRLLSALFLLPDSDWMKTFPPLAGALREDFFPLRQFSFWGEWDKTLDFLDNLSEDDRRALELFYVNYLMVTGSPDVCSPFESYYISREEVALLISNLDGQYAEDGFVVPASAYQTADHVSVQLEFMSMQCGQEAQVWEGEALEEALIRLKREDSFLNEYLLRWFPVFAERLEQKHGDTLYAQAARTGHAFLVHDKDLIASLQEKLREGVKG